MNPKERIGRLIMNLIEGVKSDVAAKLVDAVRTGAVGVDQPTLQKLILIVHGSIESTYFTAAKVNDREIAAILGQANDRASGQEIEKKGA